MRSTGGLPHTSSATLGSVIQGGGVAVDGGEVPSQKKTYYKSTYNRYDYIHTFMYQVCVQVYGTNPLIASDKGSQSDQ